MAIVQALLALIAACIAFALLARRARLPYAVVLVLGGMVLAFIPGAPRIELDPDLALAFFVPPLLQAGAYRTDWNAFKGNLRPILLLAIGAVLFTALLIGAVAKALVPGLPWAAAIALGAIVAPTDAVAAAAVLKRLSLPPRLVAVLEGESLVNDASALVLYRLALAIIAAGSASWLSVAGGFALLAAGGVACGAVVGWLAIQAIRRLADTLLETATTFIACFVAFLGAEALGASGVIAVVTAGIMLGRAQHGFSARTRRDAVAAWQFIEFVLTSLVFILIGLQLNEILGRLDGRGAGALLLLALALSLALIASRFLWVFPVAALERLFPALRRAQGEAPWKEATVVSWAGMRGVVSLAAALALPTGFPERDLIVFLAFCAILATLVAQGTTLQWLVRRLRAEQRRAPGMPAAEAAARAVVARGGLAEMERRAADELVGAIARDLLPEYRDRARLLDGIGQGAIAAERAARLELRLHALRAARTQLLAHHRAAAMEEALLMRLTEELDLEELRLRRLLGAADA